jgi:hypothetical protein
LIGESPARQANLRPLPRLIGFVPTDAQPEPAGDDRGVLDADPILPVDPATCQ